VTVEPIVGLGMTLMAVAPMAEDTVGRVDRKPEIGMSVRIESRSVGGVASSAVQLIEDQSSKLEGRS